MDTADGERLFLLAFYYFNASDTKTRACFSIRLLRGFVFQTGTSVVLVDAVAILLS